jgi:hypothetical protein
MLQSEERDRKLRIHITSARPDYEFTTELVSGLQFAGYDVFIDRHDLIAAESWNSRLGALIMEADVVVFVLSLASSKSDTCNWEANEAQKLTKRIVPVLYQSLGSERAPAALQALNYVRFDEGRSFMTGLRALDTLLRSDTDWIRFSTQILRACHNWDSAGRPANRLLSSDEHGEAKNWVNSRSVNHPPISSQVLGFIRASEEQLALEEEQRRKQLESAQLVRSAGAKTKRPKARGKIFISYRRDDVSGDARSIRDALSTKFGADRVFMDIDNLLAGQRFDQELARALDDCSVLIAVIGPRWTAELVKRRNETERDFVREEIAAALKRDIVVVPVRVGQAGQMPSLPNRHQLPPELRDLLSYQRLDITHEHFRRDVAGLAEALGQLTGWRVRRGTWASWAILGIVALAALTGLAITYHYGPVTGIPPK